MIQVYQQLSMAIIGAGSIQSADGGGRGIMVVVHVDKHQGHFN